MQLREIENGHHKMIHFLVFSMVGVMVLEEEIRYLSLR